MHDADAGILPASIGVAGLAQFVSATIQGMSGMARDGADSTQLRTIAELAVSAVPAPDRPAR
jgi:hypothetical protein